jgi:hypothetical protein
MKLSNALFLSLDDKVQPKFIVSLSKLRKLNLPIKLSFSLLKWIKDIETALTIFNEARMGLFKKYGEEKDWVLSVTGTNLQLFWKDLEELCRIDVDINLEPIDSTILENLDANLTIEDLITLDPIFKKEEVKEIKKSKSK